MLVKWKMLCKVWVKDGCFNASFIAMAKVGYELKNAVKYMVVSEDWEMKKGITIIVNTAKEYRKDVKTNQLVQTNLLRL